jgi:ubiquitin-protein ligase
MTAAQRKRLFQELSSYQTNLPIEFGSSILVRAMEGRMDQVRVLIFGPEDTPYANGCFFFDLFLSDYPRQPPKCQFLTTGGGKYRLNPNLYNCGKVCLSLLGTWSGPSWQPNESTLYQLLISIQSLILGESEPYFNEPGGETTRHIPVEQVASATYNGEIREYTCAAAILPFLKASKEQQPYLEFQEAIDLHFRLKQSVILRQLEEWSKGIHPDRKIVGGQRGTKVTTHQPTPTLYIAQCLEVLKMKVASIDHHGEDEVVLVEPVARLPPSLNKKRSRNAAKGKIHEVITLDDDGAYDTKQPAQCKRVARMPIEADKKRPATKTTVISLDEDESDVDQTGIVSNPNQKQAKSPSQPDIICWMKTDCWVYVV